MVSNKDDHLKNHGFIYVGRDRWRLSPMFDVNPAPDRNPHLETAIMEGESFDRSIELTLEASEFFDMTEDAASAVIVKTARTVSTGWRAHLARRGVTGAHARHYEPAFAHPEMEKALALKVDTM